MVAGVFAGFLTVLIIELAIIIGMLRQEFKSFGKMIDTVDEIKGIMLAVSENFQALVDDMTRVD